MLGLRERRLEKSNDVTNNLVSAKAISYPVPSGFLVTRRLVTKFLLEAFFLWKIQIRISESKNGFSVFLVNPTTDHESIKSTLRVDSTDRIQIRIFEIHNLSVFGGKDLKKVFLTSGFPNKNGTQQMPRRTCMTF